MNTGSKTTWVPASRPTQGATATADGQNTGRPSQAATIGQQRQPTEGNAEGGGLPADSGGNAGASQPTATPDASSHALALKKRPFVIRSLLWTPASPATVTSSLLSQTLDKTVLASSLNADAAQLTLTTLRKLIQPMSSYATIHRFCTPSGTILQDESITLADYFLVEPDSSASGDSAVSIYYRSPRSADPNANAPGSINNNLFGNTWGGGGTTGGFGQNSGQGFGQGVGQGFGQGFGQDTQGSMFNNPMSQQTGAQASSMQFQPLTSSIQDQPASMSTNPAFMPGALSEDQWASVLRNCAVFYGWIVDPDSGKIKRAPKQAFQLRPGAGNIPTAPNPIQSTAGTAQYQNYGSSSSPTYPGDSYGASYGTAYPSGGATDSMYQSPGVTGSSTYPVSGGGVGCSSAFPVSTDGGSSTFPVSGDGGSSTYPVSGSGGNTSAVPVSGDGGSSTVQTSGSSGTSNFPVSDSGGSSAFPVSDSGGSSNLQTASGVGASTLSTGSTAPSATATTENLTPSTVTFQTATSPSTNTAGQVNVDPSAAPGLSSQAQPNADSTPPEIFLQPMDASALLLPSEVQAQQEATRKKAEDAAVQALAAATKPSKGFPNFRINDDSKIDVSVCKHDLALSMARNDFSSQSTEASAGGGAFGVQVGVSVGYAKSDSSTSNQMSTTQTQTMVAKYMYPRCDLFLSDGDLEPTAAFAKLIAEIQKTKSINKLRQLQAEYGQLFCQQVTLGGRLLSTKIMSATATMSEEEQKQQFKVSVGLSVTSPWASGSVSHSEEKGSSSDNARKEDDSKESNVFEAVGGDTILANNPPAWASTVGNPEMWRVIERDGLVPLVDIVSKMPGYAAIQSWFVQAVPAVHKYITLPDTRSVSARFRVLTPTNSLAIPNLGSCQFYLSFADQDVSTPCQMGVSLTNFWTRVDITTPTPLFDPATYRAPVIRGFNEYVVGDAKYGADYNADFASVQWELIAPFSEVLNNGSRVILRTTPYKKADSNLKPGDDGSAATRSAHMIVFRNAQGHFVPGMSDRDEYQFWRLVKAGPNSPAGESIKPGDSVRLCWAFKDQTTGFRDYLDDVFGRRQSVPPAALAGQVLYLKVPWPRFEVTGTPTNLVMSNVSSLENTLAQVNTRKGSFKYMLQDIRFRIDVVENGPMGDTPDYLLKGLAQGMDKMTSVLAQSAGNPLQMWLRMFKFGL